MNQSELADAKRHAEDRGYDYPTWWGLGFLIENKSLLIGLLEGAGYKELAHSLTLIMRVIDPKDTK